MILLQFAFYTHVSIVSINNEQTGNSRQVTKKHKWLETRVVGNIQKSSK